MIRPLIAWYRRALAYRPSEDDVVKQLALQIGLVLYVLAALYGYVIVCQPLFRAPM